jgi:ribosomal protein S21
MVNAEVARNPGENALSLIRKFSRRVQGTGLVKTVRNQRYRARPLSKAVSKKKALKRIARRTEYQKLIKEGKVVETPRRGYGNRPQRTEAPAAPQGKSSGLGESTPVAR